MPTKYLCIDDESTTKIRPYLNSLSAASGGLEFREPKHPSPFETEIRNICDDPPDGLLLDLRLNEIAGEEEGEAKVEYRATPLAQELRTRMTERMIREFPIVLWSMERKFNESYNRDDAAQNLFDLVITKDEVLAHPVQVSILLKSLVEGYSYIESKIDTSHYKFYGMLGIEDDYYNQLDARIGERFFGQTKFPVHDYARYILRDLLEINGPLLSEACLAARLGIDIHGSGDWENCKSYFHKEGLAYTGAFSGGWPRWWAGKVENWWNSRKGIPGPLKRLDAADRVEFLKKTLRKSALTPAPPIEENHSTKYWTVCEALNRPLDPSDGLRMRCSERKPWQDQPYLSIKAVIERIAISKGLSIDRQEHEKFNLIKKMRQQANA